MRIDQDGYKDQPTVRDAKGKIIPKKISPMPGEVLLFNDWFADQLSETESPEDSWIDAIDNNKAEPETAMHVGNIKLKDFNIVELGQTLRGTDRKIFDLITIQGVSYREAEKILKIDHCVIFNKHRLILKKLGKRILKRYTIEE